jgi:hypothetical protein
VPTSPSRFATPSRNGHDEKGPRRASGAHVGE